MQPPLSGRDLYLYLSLSIYLCIIYLSIIYLSMYHLSIYVSSIYLSIYHLSIYLSIYHLSIIYLSIYLSIYLCIYHLSIYLSIYHLSPQCRNPGFSAYPASCRLPSHIQSPYFHICSYLIDAIITGKSVPWLNASSRKMRAGFWEKGNKVYYLSNKRGGQGEWTSQISVIPLLREKVHSLKGNSGAQLEDVTKCRSHNSCWPWFSRCPGISEVVCVGCQAYFLVVRER
jgi:hypothetical protein